MEENTKRDLVMISKLIDRYDHTDKNCLKQIDAISKTRKIFYTPFGEKYLNRIRGSLNGEEVDSACILCKNNPSSDGFFCKRCKIAIAQFNQPQAAKPEEAEPEPASQNAQETLKKGAETLQKGIRTAVTTVTEKLNTMAGGKGQVNLKIRDLFSAVFKKHTREEADRIFICGTSVTTPDPGEISSEWPRPWLYSRVFLFLLAGFLLITIAFYVFKNANLVPGVLFLGTCVLPLSILTFFFEVNAPQNISLFRVVQVFMIGGVFSLIVSLIFFEIAGNFSMDFFGAFLVGVIEELGKAIVVAFYIKNIKGKRYILNGLLYGAAVGTGFEVFENAGYAMRYLMGSGMPAMMNNIVTRGWTSLCGHIVWAAISGSALIIALKQEEFSWKILYSKKFLAFFLIPVILHGLWDSPLSVIRIGAIPIFHIGLGVAAWIVLLVLIHRGLEEINEINRGKPGGT